MQKHMLRDACRSVCRCCPPSQKFQKEKGIRMALLFFLLSFHTVCCLALGFVCVCVCVCVCVAVQKLLPSITLTAINNRMIKCELRQVINRTLGYQSQ